MVRYFLLGLLVGWLLEWIIDWVWWRRSEGQVEAGSRSRFAANAAIRNDDLTRIEGIGPELAGLLVDAGIRSFADLAVAPSSRLAGILTDAGWNFRLADPGTWPEQALLAGREEWEALDRLQAQLRGGVRVSSE